VVLPVDLKAGYYAHKAEIDQAINRVLQSGWYILGPEVADFEQDFARYLGTRHAIGVANGTDALCLALRACGIGAGDAVITASHTAVATVAAIELVGAAPLLVEVDPDTYTLDPARLEETVRRTNAASGRLKAIIPVHLYGCPAALPAILEIAHRYGLRVIEDCAQAHGAALGGRRVGAWADIGCFSFYPTKNLGALGDGGAVVTDDDALAQQLHALREYGWRQRYISESPGMNTRLDAIQAAILGVKLKYLDAENARRRQIADLYDKMLQSTGLVLPQTPSGATHVFHQYVVRTPDRDGLQADLKARGIGTLIHYPAPVHTQPAYLGRIALGAGGLGLSEEICRTVLSLPMYPQMSDDQVREVGKGILLWAGEGARA
jgi:dTDP-4-amino-4,6-dideoxygalactose transaminase